MRGALRMGLRNLRRNRRRTLATGLSIALGIAGLLIVFGYVARVERYLATAQTYVLHSGHLAIYKESGFEKFAVDPVKYGFSAEEQAKVRSSLAKDANVLRVVPVLQANGLASNGCRTTPYKAVGVDLEDERWIRSQPMVLEHTPELARFIRGRGPWEVEGVDAPIAVSTGLAKAMWKTRVLDEVAAAGADVEVPDCNAADAVAQVGRDANLQLVAGTFNGTMGALDTDIVAVMNPGFTEYEDTGLLVNLPALQRLYETEAVTSFAVFLEHAGDIGDRARALEAGLRGQGLTVTVYPWNDLRTSPQYVSVRGMLTVIGGFMFGVMGLVVTLSIANAMTITVIERRPELGTLRSLGFTPRQLFRLLLGEALVLLAIAGTAGLSIGFLAASIINASNIRFSPPRISGTLQLLFRPTPMMCLYIGGSVAVLTIFATWITARRTLRKGIVELLHAAG